MNPDFRYWDSVDPKGFLAHDWDNPSRQWAAQRAIDAALGGTLLEVGPGPGKDYELHFQAPVKAGEMEYVAFEGSENLCGALRARFPESKWYHAPIADLSARMADVVYARHVLEHQPALEPALGLVLAAARLAVVLTWYRPPGPQAFFEVWEGVHCQTYHRTIVKDAIAGHGFAVKSVQGFPNTKDEAWVLERIR